MHSAQQKKKRFRKGEQEVVRKKNGKERKTDKDWYRHQNNKKFNSQHSFTF